MAVFEKQSLMPDERIVEIEELNLHFDDGFEQRGEPEIERPNANADADQVKNFAAGRGDSSLLRVVIDRCQLQENAGLALRFNTPRHWGK